MAYKVCIRNRRDLQEVEEGDLIEFERGIYSHWAVYVGDEKVVHLTGIEGGPIQSAPQHSFTICGKQFNKAVVTKDNFWVVADGSRAYKNNTKDDSLGARPKREIVREALSRIGEMGYNIITRNCEHFAKFCRYGEERSDQVRDVAIWGTLGLAAGVILSGLFGKDKK